ncbi:MAG: glycosyl hydrolase family 18 protein [Asticcacaulis sp.]
MIPITKSALALTAAMMVYTNAPAAVAQPATGAQRPVAIGYVPAFKNMDAVMAQADLKQYTHLNISFVNPAADGAILNGDRFACMNDASGQPVTDSDFRAAVSKAHENGNKILVSLGGGYIPECSGNWAELLKPENRPEVVRHLIALVDTYDLDGLDVDIEGVLLTEIDQAGNYTPFIAELSQALKARGKLLTCATASYEGGMIPVSSIPYFDLVNIMAYDAIGPGWGQAGDEHSPYAQAERDMALWRARGVAQDKLVLGVPFYGYGYGQYRSGYNFRDLLAEYGPEVFDKDVWGKRCAGCDYITYNGLETLSRKAQLGVRSGAGIMVWEISQDTDDHRLIRTLNEAMQKARD